MVGSVLRGSSDAARFYQIGWGRKSVRKSASSPQESREILDAGPVDSGVQGPDEPARGSWGREVVRRRGSGYDGTPSELRPTPVESVRRGGAIPMRVGKVMASRKKDRMPRRLFKQGRMPAIPPGSKVVYEPAGREKMSDVLEDFIEPYRDMADTEDAFRKLLTLALLAWNAALLPEDRRRTMIDETLGAGFSRASEADRSQAREFVEVMVRRKEEYFPSNRRAIISFELTDKGDDYHLSVASTL
jgi:hypothetical protein